LSAIDKHKHTHEHCIEQINQYMRTNLHMQQASNKKKNKIYDHQEQIKIVGHSKIYAGFVVVVVVVFFLK
jgi:uncharacterized membrane protein